MIVRSSMLLTPIRIFIPTTKPVMSSTWIVHSPTFTFLESVDEALDLFNGVDGVVLSTRTKDSVLELSTVVPRSLGPVPPSDFDIGVVVAAGVAASRTVPVPAFATVSVVDDVGAAAAAELLDVLPPSRLITRFLNPLNW